MTPEKQKQKLAGHTAIAQKIFQAVPVAEAWTVGQVAAALHRATGSRIDQHTMLGCLRAMADAGLVRTTGRGMLFQRAPVSTPAADAATDKTKDVTVTQTANLAAAPTPVPTPASAIDVIGAATKKIRAIADELDAWALACEEEKSRVAGEVDKLKQLKALLKEIA